MGWQPTHAVPGGGLPVWDEPDGNRQPVHHLAGGLPVQLVEARGPWGRVVCDNGFGGWVDGAQLVAIGAPGPAPAPAPAVPPRAASATSRNRVLLWIGAAAVVAFGVIGALLAAGRADDVGVGSRDDEAADDDSGDEDDGGADDDGGGRGAGSVALHVPDGWSVSDDGLVAAESGADLDAADPAGPIVRAEVGDGDDPALDELASAALAAEDPVEFTEPEEQRVDGFDAVSITIRVGGRVQAFVAVHPPGEAAVLFTIDCPAERFDELKSLLGGIPGIDAG